MGRRAAGIEETITANWTIQGYTPGDMAKRKPQGRHQPGRNGLPTSPKIKNNVDGSESRKANMIHHDGESLRRELMSVLSASEDHFVSVRLTGDSLTKVIEQHVPVFVFHVLDQIVDLIVWLRAGVTRRRRSYGYVETDGITYDDDRLGDTGISRCAPVFFNQGSPGASTHLRRRGTEHNDPPRPQLFVQRLVEITLVSSVEARFRVISTERAL